tara:strand:- start:669 stop:884 length:216 start_codon:yes stop_codon:yes gene_type:complete
VPERNWPQDLFLFEPIHCLAFSIKVEAISSYKLQIGRVISDGIEVAPLLVFLLLHMGFQGLGSCQLLFESA